MTKYTYRAQSVDDAIKAGLKDLNLTEDQVKIEVLEAGSSGLFGLFKKEAIVELTPLDDNYKKEAIEKEEIVEEKIEKVAEKFEQEEVVVTPVLEKEATEEEKVEKKEKKDKKDPIVKNKDSIVNYMTKIVHAMGFDSAVLTFKEEGNKNYTLKITNVENTSLLIGKRGNTLNSLQALANNYGKKFTKYYFRINIDCDDYRDNRKETLEELAINMAKKSKKLGKPIKLEPMTSFERKIIHNTLTEIKNVETESHGEEPYRYLVITAK